MALVVGACRRMVVHAGDVTCHATRSDADASSHGFYLPLGQYCDLEQRTLQQLQTDV